MRIVMALLATMLLSSGFPILAGDCPTAVLAAVDKAHSGAKTLACKSEQEGTTVYEVKIRTSDGKKLELAVRPDGAILLTEEPIATSELPAAVLAGVHARYPDARVTEVERLTAEKGEISFEVELTSGGHKQSITLTEAGAVVALEDEDEDAAADEDD